MDAEQMGEALDNMWVGSQDFASLRAFDAGERDHHRLIRNRRDDEIPVEDCREMAFRLEVFRVFLEEVSRS